MPPFCSPQDKPSDKWPELLAESTGGERLRRLVALSELEYMGAEYYDWRARQPESSFERTSNPKSNPQQDNERGTAGFARSKSYAQQALALAPTVTNGPEYPDAVFRAHIAFGLNVFREGDRNSAVRHLLEASRAPSGEPSTVPRSLLEGRLVNYLLKHGERETVAEYLERAAASRTPAVRERMLKDAAAIRAGTMPEGYQRSLATGHL
jgi:hypothetical protein